MCAEFTPPSVVYGVVSEADDAARWGAESDPESWVCRGVVGDDTLTVDRCAPVADWFDHDGAVVPSDANGPSDGPSSSSAPSPLATAAGRSSDGRPPLATFLADLPATAAAGLDFPFGLPERLVVADSWPAFLRDLPTWCSSPAELRWRCEQRVELVDGTTETRVRATDAPLSALSPFDERIVASTFFGLRDVLRPLVLTDRVRVPPMTPPQPDRPLLVEVYPAGTLVDLDLTPVAGGDDGSDRREATVDDLAATVDCDLDVDDAVRERVVAADAAVESLVAAYAVYRNTRDAAALGVGDDQRRIEGQIFV